MNYAIKAHVESQSKVYVGEKSYPRQGVNDPRSLILEAPRMIAFQGRPQRGLRIQLLSCLVHAWDNSKSSIDSDEQIDVHLI